MIRSYLNRISIQRQLRFCVEITNQSPAARRSLGCASCAPLLVRAVHLVPRQRGGTGGARVPHILEGEPPPILAKLRDDPPDPPCPTPTCAVAMVPIPIPILRVVMSRLSPLAIDPPIHKREPRT